MKPTYKIFLDERSPKRDGSCPIAFRITFKRKTTTISTGYFALKGEWDSSGCKIISKRHDKSTVIRINNYLDKRRGQLSELFQRLQFDDMVQQMSSTELFQLVRNKSNDTKVNFFTEIESRMQHLWINGKFTNYGHFKSTLSVLRKFVGNKELYAIELTTSFLERFEQYYLSQSTYRHGRVVNKCLNGLAPHLRRIRMLLNLLVKQGKLPITHIPFKHYKIKTERTIKRSLTIEQIKGILSLNLKPYSGDWHARNYFMACFYMQGASLTDIARLKIRDISNGEISYRRAKNRQYISVVISPALEIIFKFYVDNKCADDYIFPIIKSNLEAEREILKQVHSADIKINQHLRELAIKAGISNKYISTYWARHSYATNLKRRNTPISVISDSLGHRSMLTTQIYLAELDNSVIARYNEAMFKELEQVS